MPDMASSDITDSLMRKLLSYFTPFLGFRSGFFHRWYCYRTPYYFDSAFSKAAGFDLDTYEKEDDDIDGPFTLAVSIETSGGGQMIWFSASDFLSDMYNAYSSGANVDLAMNSLSSLIGEREAIAIRSKSLNYNYLTINDSTSTTLKALMIGVFPLVYLGIGIYIIVRKRGKQK